MVRRPITWTRSWRWRFGLRNSYEVKEGSNVGWIGDWNAAFTPKQVTTAVAGANGGVAYFDTGGESKSRNMLTGLFNPSYKYNDNILLYTLVGRGEKAGAVNVSALPIFNSASQFQGFQPVITKAEYSWDYEIGAKTSWLDEKLIFTTNFYWTDIFNFQANIADTSYTNANGTPLATTYLGTVPHVRLRGWEFAGRYSPIENLWLTFNGAYTDARYIDYPDAPPPNDWLWTTNVATPLGVVSHPLTLSLSNTRFTGLPKWTFNLGANYERKVGKVLESVGGFWGEQNYTAYGWWNFAFFDTIQFTNPWSLIQYWQSPYTIVNAGVGSAHRRQALCAGTLGEKPVRHALYRAERNLDARHRHRAGLLHYSGATALLRPHFSRATRRRDIHRLARRRNGSSEHQIAFSGAATPVDRHLCGRQCRLWLGRAL